MKAGPGLLATRVVARLALSLLALSLALPLLALPLLALPLLVTSPVAHAAEPQAWARISIDAVTPALPRRDQPAREITIAGRITNTGDVELSNLQVAYWRSLDPIQTAAGMARALASAADEPLGARAQNGSLYVDVPSATDRTLAPGESTRFAISATLAQLEIPDIDGVYLVGVHLRGRTEPSGPDITLGRGRAFLPVVSDPPADSVRQASLVVLASRPSLLRTGLFLDDHLVAELSEGGRLARLLRAAGAEGTSFAIDPALAEEVATMADGYLVERAGGGARPGGGAAVARGWLAELEALISSGDGYRLLYGNPDAAALVHHDRPDLLDLSAQAGARVSITAGLPLLALPGDGTADAETVAALAALHPTAIVLSDATVRTAARSPVLTGPAGIPLIRYTARASGGGPGPAPRNTPAKVQQRMLSDTWIAAASGPEGSPAGRVRLISEPSQSAGADNEVAAPWLEPATLAELLAGAPVSWSQDYRYTGRARRAELTTAQLATTQRLTDQFARYTDLLVDPRNARAEAAIALPRSVSLAWRSEVADSRRYTGAVASHLTDILLDWVAISVTPKVSTTGRTGSFPVTIRNDLPPTDPTADPAASAAANAVKVRIEFDSPAQQRLRVEPLDVPPVNAGESITVTAQVHAETNGTFLVRAQLRAQGGGPVGRAETIEVSASRAGTTGWLIAIAAGIVLIGTTVLRIRQVARERARRGQEPAPLAVSRPADEVGDGTKAPPDV